MHAQGYTTLQLYSLLFVATRRTAFVAACHTVCYLLPHAVQLCFAAACHTVCYLLLYAVELLLLPHAVQFAARCHMPYNLLFITAPYSCFFLPHTVQLFLAAACRTVCYLLLYCRVAFVAVCCTVCYLLPHAVQLLFLPHAVHFAICCSALYSCYLLLYAVHFAICCHMPYCCYLQWNLCIMDTLGPTKSVQIIKVS